MVPLATDVPYVSRYLRMVEPTTLAGESQTAIGEGIWPPSVARIPNRAKARGWKRGDWKFHLGSQPD